METIDLEVSGFLHQASLHRAMSHRKNKTIVYYHGGGFIFGSKDDLPAYAIEKLTSAGYDLFCMEYPKAPEMSLSQICDFVKEQLIWFQVNHKKLNLSEDYILFGRSAGGFLVLELAKQMATMNRKVPDKLIVFYGYEDLVEEEFVLPSNHYLKYPRLGWDDVKSAIEKPPIYTSNLLKRYPLYIYARQTGNWLKMLQLDAYSKKALDEDIQELPSIFLAASYHDKDVSYQNSLKLNKKYYNSVLFTSWSDKHEFDQIESGESEDLYKKLLSWLKY
jgi:acetyl esterase